MIYTCAQLFFFNTQFFKAGDVRFWIVKNTDRMLRIRHYITGADLNHITPPPPACAASMENPKDAFFSDVKLRFFTEKGYLDLDRKFFPHAPCPVARP